MKAVFPQTSRVNGFFVMTVDPAKIQKQNRRAAHSFSRFRTSCRSFSISFLTAGISC